MSRGEGKKKDNPGFSGVRLPAEPFEVRADAADKLR